MRILLMFLICLTTWANDDCQSVTLTTPNATFEGCQQGTSQAFRGIRFANAKRWQAPEIIVPSGTIDATAYKPYCAQIPYDAATMMEDCLFLNVWKPKDADNLPVFFWIHGGGYIQGSGAQLNFDGQYLAETYNVVVVTINYRLGFLGFRHQATGTGNFGILDQVTALQWTQANIANFGGNPDAVTIVGESAGAMSVGVQLTLDVSRDLFHNAVMESSYYGVSYMSAEEAGRIAEYMNTAMKACKAQPCSTEEVVNIQQLFMDNFTMLEDMWLFGPYMDGSLVKAQPITARIEKPVILGTNQAEATLFTFQYKRNFNNTDYLLEIVKFFGLDNAAKIVKQPRYDAAKQGAYQALWNVVQDAYFVCSTRYLLGNAQDDSTYGYDFTYQSSFAFYPHFPPCDEAVCHGEDLPYVFNTAYDVAGDTVKFNATDEAVAQKVSRYWANLTKSQTPGDGWGTFAENGRLILTSGTAEEYTQDSDCDCDFWDKLIYEAGGTMDTVNRMLDMATGKKVLEGEKLHDPRWH